MDGPAFASPFGTSSHSTFSPHEQSPSTPSTPTFANAALPNDLLSASVSSILLSSPRAGYTPIHPALSHAWNLRLSPRQPPSPREISAIQASAAVGGSPCFSDSPPSHNGLPKREHQLFTQTVVQGGGKGNSDHLIVKQPVQRSLSPSRERRKYLSAAAAQAVEACGVGVVAQSSVACTVVVGGASDGADIIRQGLDSPSTCECAREGHGGAAHTPMFKSMSESQMARCRSCSSLVPASVAQPSPTSRCIGFASQSVRSRPAGRPPRPPSRSRQRGPPVIVFMAAIFHFIGSMVGLGTGTRATWGRSSGARFTSSYSLSRGSLGKVGTLPSNGVRGNKAGNDMRMLPLVALLLVLFIVLTALQGLFPATSGVTVVDSQPFNSYDHVHGLEVTKVTADTAGITLGSGSAGLATTTAAAAAAASGTAMKRRELLEVTAVSLAKGALELRGGSQVDDSMDEIAVSGLAYAAIQRSLGSGKDTGVVGQGKGAHSTAATFGALSDQVVPHRQLQQVEGQQKGAMVAASGRNVAAEQQGHNEDVAVLVSSRLVAERMILSDSRVSMSPLRGAAGGRKAI